MLAGRLAAVATAGRVLRPPQLDRWDAAIGAYAVLAAFCAPLTAPAVVAVLVPGSALLLARARRPVRPMPAGGRPRRAGLLWAGLGVAACLWEVVAMLWGNDEQHPTLSLLLDPVLDTYPGRVLGYVAWLSVGRWLVTR